MYNIFKYREPNVTETLAGLPMAVVIIPSRIWNEIWMNKTFSFLKK